MGQEKEVTIKACEKVHYNGSASTFLLHIKSKRYLRHRVASAVNQSNQMTVCLETLGLEKLDNSLTFKKFQYVCKR